MSFPTPYHLKIMCLPASDNEYLADLYIKLANERIDSEDGRYLYRFSQTDLIKRGAWLVTAFDPKCPLHLVGALYTHTDAEGCQWIRGIVVRPEIKGQRLCARMIKQAMAIDALAKSRKIGVTVAIRVLPNEGRNEACLRALIPLGFIDNDEIECTNFRQNYADSHLKPWAEDGVDGEKILRYQRLYISEINSMKVGKNNAQNQYFCQ